MYNIVQKPSYESYEGFILFVSPLVSWLIFEPFRWHFHIKPLGFGRASNFLITFSDVQESTRHLSAEINPELPEDVFPINLPAQMDLQKDCTIERFLSVDL